MALQKGRERTIHFKDCAVQGDFNLGFEYGEDVYSSFPVDLTLFQGRPAGDQTDDIGSASI